jgi:class 3 adenylate cyclase
MSALSDPVPGPADLPREDSTRLPHATRFTTPPARDSIGGASIRGAEPVNTPARILIADDNAANVKILQTRLRAEGYDIIVARDGEEALEAVRTRDPDLVLLDVMMPRLDGLAVCRRMREDASLGFIPVILVTAMADPKDVVAGLEAGGDEYLTKPVDQTALVARVRSMLRIKMLHDTVHTQAAQLAQWNATLEQRVDEQVAELERVGRLKRFFSPQLAELIVAGGADDPLKTHRREITVAFLDLRGFTAFAETAEPEEVMGVLREYHAEMGRLILAHEGTLERFTGDGMMVFFNDPVPVERPAERAVRMALTMQQRVEELGRGWRKLGYNLGLGVGIAQGYATIGAIGFEGRWDYAAIGTVTNLAARLCGEARPGQTLVSARVAAALEPALESEAMGTLTLKGLVNPVPVFSVTRFRPAGDPADRA